MVTELEREFQQGLDKIHLLEIRIKVLEGLTMQLRQNEPLVRFALRGVYHQC